MVFVDRPAPIFDIFVDIDLRTDPARQLELTTKEVSLENFLADIGQMSSQNRLLLFNLVLRLKTKFDSIPLPYNSFLAKLCKSSSVSGYLQPTGPLPLQLLQLLQVRLFSSKTNDYVRVTTMHHTELVKTFYSQVKELHVFQ